MPRKKKARKVKAKPVVGIGWYTPREWAEVRRTAVDPDRLENTFEEWEAMAEEALVRLQVQDDAFIFRRVPINAAALARWCLAEGRENNGAARAAFTATQLRLGTTPSAVRSETS